MKKDNTLLTILLCLLVVLLLLIIFIFLPQQERKKIAPIAKKENKNIVLQEVNFYQIKDGKLPQPKDFLDTKITGTLTYQNAIQIARDYFNEKSYENALFWSYRAYQIESSSKEAWTLYAKSLRKLGYKKEALEILKYYQEHH